MESVILTHSPAEVLRAVLIQLGQATTGTAYGQWPVFADMEPDTPDNCVTLYDTQGIIQGRNHPDGEVQENQGLQVRVRGVKDSTVTPALHGSQVAYRQAASICRILDQTVCRTTVNLDSSTYIIHSANRASSILKLGRMRDNRERYVCTVNYLIAMAEILS